MREVKIKVIDKSTKKPLSNIPVVYALMTSNWKNEILPFIPNIEEDRHEKYEECYELKTDINGEFVIPRHSFKVNWPRKLYHEDILINLDFNESEPKDKKKDLYIGTSPYLSDLTAFSHGINSNGIVNPEKHHKGYLICSSFDDKKKYECGEIGCIDYNPNIMLSKKDVKLVVELEKKK